MPDHVTAPPAPGAPASWRTRTPGERLAAAQEYLRGKTAPFADLRDLGFAMKDLDKRFTHARRLLLRARRHAEYTAQSEQTRRKVLQQLALCTYKDDDLPAERRFERALAWLREIAPLDALADQESLCLGGAIFKRQWESTGVVACLEQSLEFYERGHAAAGPTAEAYDGYAAINAAFVSDLLAIERARTLAGRTAALELRTRADALRREILAVLPSRAPAAHPLAQWWLFVTIAEAHVGLLEWEAAAQWLHDALALPDVYAWQEESTARQLASLAHTIAQRHEADGARAYDVIQRAFSLPPEARQALVLGRFGLALSGGGFRASLFHIGVLARLAELDVLRHVEVLSCVSGGSIVGAYYFLELRSRMMQLGDAEMTRDEYVAIVRRVEERFLEGVQTNLRSSIPTNLVSNLRMIVDPGYTRTNRLGDLYESRLFARVPVPAATSPDAGVPSPVWIGELPFAPKDAPRPFNPKTHNWKRAAKVPMLVLNATTLNTGHSWQFTATWMGEAASTVDSRIDSNDYLRRMYYGEAPGRYGGRGVRLGDAVAASSCVPGLFPPLKLAKLYKDHPVVRLVDGGVHDNQGIAALLDQDCSVMLVSDASGQMRSQENPPGGTLAGAARSNSVLQARVRLAQYRELDARHRGGALRGLTWVHLREGLESRAVDWNDCGDPFSREDEGLSEEARGPLLGHGVHRDIQDALARLRTDLDSFSDAEAHALMCSAYLMTGTALRAAGGPFATLPAREEPWRFRGIEPHLQSSQAKAPVTRALRVGEQLALKVWRLSPGLGALGTLALLVTGLALLYGAQWLAVRVGLLAAEVHLVSQAVSVGTLAALAAAVVAARWALRVFGGAGEVVERATVGVLTFLLFVPMWVHRVVFDPAFLRRGRYTPK
jgi:predicted acylesterase/phospholipase RssA